MEGRGEPVTGGRKDLAHRGVWDRESISKSVHSWDFPLRVLVKTRFLHLGNCFLKQLSKASQTLLLLTSCLAAGVLVWKWWRGSLRSSAEHRHRPGILSSLDPGRYLGSGRPPLVHWAKNSLTQGFFVFSCFYWHMTTTFQSSSLGTKRLEWSGDEGWESMVGGVRGWRAQ